MDLQRWKDLQNTTKDLVLSSNTNNLVLAKLPTDDNTVQLERVAGFDISFSKNDPNSAVSALVILEFPSLNILYHDYELIQMRQPYVPGFLAAREIDPYLRLFNKLKPLKHLIPQIVFIDGNGILHPRRCGLACQLGILLDIPAIGVSKNFLKLEDLQQLDPKSIKATLAELSKNDIFEHYITGSDGFTYGKAITSKGSVNPIFVSVGHKISLDFAVEIVNACSKYRIPEPTRQADIYSRMVAAQLNI